ncbi:MAG: VOC family protein [bacterium]
MLCALQHVGMGVSDARASYGFYRERLGFDLKLVDWQGRSEELVPFIGELAEVRIIMALNPLKRGAVELVKLVSTPSHRNRDRWGDIGYLASGYRATNLAALAREWEKLGIAFEVPVQSIRLADGRRREFAFLRDPDANLVELVDSTPDTPCRPAVTGLTQVTIGVRNLDRALVFYRDVIGYDKVLYEASGRASAFDPLLRGQVNQREVLLGRSTSLEGPFVVPGGGTLRLVQALEYEGRDLSEGRPWGDPGFQMESGFEVPNIRSAVEQLKASKQEIFRPATHMNMGSGSRGYFAYVKDPDGNLVEFVEVRRVAWLSPRTLSFIWPILPWLVRRMSK